MSKYKYKKRKVSLPLWCSLLKYLVTALGVYDSIDYTFTLNHIGSSGPREKKLSLLSTSLMGIFGCVNVCIKHSGRRNSVFLWACSKVPLSFLFTTSTPGIKMDNYWNLVTYHIMKVEPRSIPNFESRIRPERIWAIIHVSSKILLGKRPRRLRRAWIYSVSKAFEITLHKWLLSLSLFKLEIGTSPFSVV